MPYIFARLGLALLFTFFSGVLLLICLRLQDGLGLTLAQLIEALLHEDLGEDGPLVAVLCPWLVGTIVLRFITVRYAGYLLKAGHIAVVSEALAKGVVPEKQIRFGKQAVLERFGTTHAYFVLDMLVDGAVDQLCKAVSKVGEAFENIPGVSAVSGVAQLFLRIALGHVDACCLALTFHRKSGNAFKDAADSVVLYFQNWKTLLKNASVATLVCCALYGVLGILSLIVFACFMDMDETGMPAAFAGVFFFLAVKTSFIDSWVMIKMVAGFFEKSKDTEPAADLYGKLADLSSKFRDLLRRSGEDNQGI
ncbi:MAG: hypothetical protein LBD42_01530 [Desulfovibrio sp.]|nr:hypothetical protein [Desulfovibrio sp.]